MRRTLVGALAIGITLFVLSLVQIKGGTKSDIVPPAPDLSPHTTR